MIPYKLTDKAHAHLGGTFDDAVAELQAFGEAMGDCDTMHLTPSGGDLMRLAAVLRASRQASAPPKAARLDTPPEVGGEQVPIDSRAASIEAAKLCPKGRRLAGARVLVLVAGQWLDAGGGPVPALALAEAVDLAARGAEVALVKLCGCCAASPLRVEVL